MILRRGRKGFTLMELVVVTMIIGIIAGLGVPQYFRAVESSKATDSIGIAHNISAANRMYNIDYPNAALSYLSGKITDSCNGAACTNPPSTACDLVACNYLAKQSWDSSAYDFYACNATSGAGGGCCAAGYTSCSTRKSGAYPTFSGWGYSFDRYGKCDELATDNPRCPQF